MIQLTLVGTAETKLLDLNQDSLQRVRGKATVLRRFVLPKRFLSKRLLVKRFLSKKFLSKGFLTKIFL